MRFLRTVTSQLLLKRLRNANCKIVATARRRHITAYAIARSLHHRIADKGSRAEHARIAGALLVGRTIYAYTDDSGSFLSVIGCYSQPLGELYGATTPIVSIS